jgi:hypothetical protein
LTRPGQFPPIEHAIEREESEAMTINHMDPQPQEDLDRDNSDTERRENAGFLPDIGYSGQESWDNGTVNPAETMSLESAVTPLQMEINNCLTTRAQRTRRAPRRWNSYDMNEFV